MALEMARGVLQRIVKRLEPFERTFLRRGNDPEQELQTGVLQLRNALRRARDTLSSESDPNFVIVQALDCQTLFGDGCLLIYKHHQITIPNIEAGRKSGKARRKDEQRQPFVDLYWEKVGAGVPYLRARNECMDLAEKAGVSFPSSVTSQNEWFPKPKIQ